MVLVIAYRLVSWSTVYRLGHIFKLVKYTGETIGFVKLTDDFL